MTEAEAAPGGTVTFLFSDIERSTQLEQALGTERYGQVLERHRALLRAAWQANGGIEQGTEGDSFFVTFGRATSALAAAIAGQRALHGEAWPDGVDVRVRMGLHTGESERIGAAAGGGGMVGIDINQAARVAAVAHGGQILMSDATSGLLATHLPPDVTLRDLGAFRLKDLLAPVHLVQVIVDGLPSEFPAPRTPDAHPNNLPTQLTTFVGRDAELAEAATLLGTTRLLTLTGPGGTGKTRLSLQLAARVSDDFADGVFFVPLEPIRDPMLVAPRIAGAVGVVGRRAPGRSPIRSPTGCATGRCCSCSTTSSRSSRRRRSSPTCCGPRPGSRSSSPAGRPCTCRASRSTRCRACRRHPIPAT